MRVLITGARGQVAQAMLADAPAGYEVIARDRAQLDLTDPQAIAREIRVIRPDWVVNAGAFTQVDAAETSEALAMAVNAGAPRAMAEALALTGGRLLQISTDYVFDGSAQRPYRPHDAPSPLSAYGKSKVLGEQAAGAGALVVRSGWLYAARGRNFVLAMLARMAAQAEVRVVADQIGTPTWVGSLAEALWSLMRARATGLYHFRDGGEASWYDFAQAIGEEATALGLLDAMPRIVPILASEFPTAAQRPRYSVLDDSETRALLGQPPVPWRINLRRVIEAVACG